MKDQAAAWVEVGRRIRAAREAMEGEPSARQMATQAGWSPTYWQDLERGSRLDGGRFNPSTKKLVAAAEAVELDPKVILGIIGRDYKPTRPRSSKQSSDRHRMDALEVRMAAIEKKIERIAG